MSKAPKKDSTEIFTIEFDQANDSSEIPSITQLLASKSKKQSVQDNGLKSLQEFGTVLEVHFALKENSYVFVSYNSLGSEKFLGADSLFNKMKIPTKFMQEFGVFAEIEAKEKTYLFGAFGVNDQNYLQFVLNQTNKLLTVYVSDRSMASKKDDVITYAENKNKNVDSGDSGDSGGTSGSGIELDMAS